MVQALVDISPRTNKLLNILKAFYGFRDKSKAIDFMAQQYEDEVFDREFKPGFIKQVLESEKRPASRIKIEEFEKHFKIKN